MMNDLTIEELKKIRDDALDAVAATYAATYTAATAAWGAFTAADAAYDAALNKKEGPKIIIERWFNVVQSPDYGLYIEQYSTKDAAIAARQVHGDTIITKAIPFVWRG
jgi:hypothetical protein